MKATKTLEIEGNPVLVSLELQQPGEFGTVVLRGEMRFVEQAESDTTASTSRKKLIHRLRNIERWEQTHFPHYTPRICLELFKLLGEGKPDGRPYTVKEIVLATGFSERAVRGQLSRFEAHDWIERQKNQMDRRNSHIQPSDALKSAYHNWISLHLA